MNKTKYFRFRKTENFLNKHLSKNEQILDLGTPNELSIFLQNKGYDINSCHGFDFDLEHEKINNYDYDTFVAFEVFEHLVSPFPILRDIKAKKLVITVPLRLWFAKAYRNQNDPYDQHYHEFESWQLDMLIEKAGWKIIAREKWTPPFQFNGIRSILRAFTPRFYAVYAKRE